MIEDGFLPALIDEIKALGYDEATATDYAVLIGDRPIVAEDGRIVVMEKGRELARLALKILDDGEESGVEPLPERCRQPAATQPHYCRPIASSQDWLS